MNSYRLATAVGVVVGCTVANFGYQFAGDAPNYIVALDRSLFQFVACFTMYLMGRA